MSRTNRIYRRIATVQICSMLFLAPQSVAQTCTEGTNQPPRFIVSGSYVAFPKYGTRAWFGGQWVTMDSSGVRYVYCDAGPSGQSLYCPTNGGGDYGFTGTQKSAMNTGFANWTSAKTANGSNLSFTQVTTSVYGLSPFAIEIRRMLDVTMGTAAARVITSGWASMDYNNDGTHDEYRIVDAIIEVAYSTSLMTEMMVHEVGHVMGLENWAA